MAEVMLAFITWLTRQEFGRKCVVSIRDILSWVNFMNSMAEDAAVKRPEAISTVTSFVHAACLVYIDGIGSGMFSLGDSRLDRQRKVGVGSKTRTRSYIFRIILSVYFNTLHAF